MCVDNLMCGSCLQLVELVKLGPHHNHCHLCSITTCALETPCPCGARTPTC